MLRGKLIHPEILEALGRAGHGSQILIADGNYPASTSLGINSRLVSLNLSPGIVTCTDVLNALVSAVPIEQAVVMEPAKKGPYAMKDEPEIWTEFRGILLSAGFEKVFLCQIRPYFYKAAAGPDVCLTIVTGEKRIYANLLLTIGVIRNG